MDLERLAHMPTVKVAMSPFPYSIEADAALASARAMMDEHGIHHLPVTEDGELVGVLSSREVTLATGLADLAGAAEPCVRDAVDRSPFVVEDDAPLDAVLARMTRERRSAAIVTRRGKLVGVFTMTDATRLLTDWLRARFPRGPDGTDAA
jgi:acetoin utilization protein AcuB